MKKILVVDDNVHMHSLMKTILEGEGYSVDSSRTGDEGLARMKNASYDVVVLDYMLPGTSGMDVLKDIKRGEFDAEVIMVTGHGSEKVAVEIMKLGAADYIQKPFSKKDLIDAVRRVIAARAEYSKGASNASILVVDDDKAVLSFVASALSGIGTVQTVDDPMQAVVLVGEKNFDVIVTDVFMPRISGVELLSRVGITNPSASTIVMSSSDDPGMLRELLRNGAVDYLKKPFTQGEVREAVVAVIARRRKEFFDRLKKHFDVQQMRDDERSEFILGTVEALIMALEARDKYTRGHSERVTGYSMAIAEKLGLDEAVCDVVRHSARLHDLGKIGIEDAYLRKQGSLTEEERRSMARHPEVGFVILKSIKLLKDYIPGVKHHHERYDGKGYPDGLAGGEIPLVARIIAVADACDAMLSSRPYRDALGKDIAMDELSKHSGSQFDPEVIGAIMKVLAEGRPGGKE